MPKLKKKSKDDTETWKIAKPMATLNQIVFATLEKKSWWPAIVIDGILCDQERKKENYEWVYWFEDERVSFVSHENICSFRDMFLKLGRKKSTNKYLAGVRKALQECAIQDGCRIENADELFKWGLDGFPQDGPEGRKRDLSLSIEVTHDLEDIKALSMAQRKTSGSGTSLNMKKDKGAAAPVTSERCSPLNKSLGNISSPKPEYNTGQSLASKLSKEQSVENVCISCRVTDKKVKQAHPLFHGGICEDCEDNLKKYMFALDEDGFMMVCIICGKTGELLLCDRVGCRRAICTKCIVDMATENALINFKKQNPWFCMLCRNYNKATDGLLVAREDWHEKMVKLFQPSSIPLKMNLSQIKKKNGLRVLSLFDGISSGYYALSKLGITIECYYALEIDEHAIFVSKTNFPGKITYLGDVEYLTSDKLAELGPFHLVIGGSPCNDLSAVNPARKGLYAHESTGRLFFEYFRVLKVVESLVEEPIFWMYENVASMPVTYREIINRFLECEPALIDAEKFSAQHRPRFFWSNIPGVNYLSEVETSDCPTLSSAISSSSMRVANVDKINTVTTQKNSLKKRNLHPVSMNGEFSGIWITELEAVFGLPLHFTDVANLSIQQRLKLLGKSWSIPVIVNIFSPLRHFFEVSE